MLGEAMTNIIGRRLAVLLDGGGRFVALLYVTPDTKRIVGLPQTRMDVAQNDRLGLIADRLVPLHSERSFRLRGVYTGLGEQSPPLIFKEEST